MGRRIAALGIASSLVLLTSLALLILAQVTVSIPGCSSVMVYPSNAYGGLQTTFTTGQVIYVTLRSTYTCKVYVTITTRDPTGGVSTIVNKQLFTLPASANVVIQLFQVSSVNPSGQWTIYVTLNNTGLPPLAINVNPPPTSSPPASSTSPTLTPSSHGLTSLPIWLLVTIIVVVIAVVASVLAVVLTRGGGGRVEERTRVLPAPIQPIPQAAPERERTRVGVILYRLRLPNGMEVPVSEPYRVFGRETFERYGLPKDILDFITREDRGGHFKIYLRGMKWFIEDSGSTNGTLLNGVEIRGKGPQELKDGDTISPGGVLNLTFQIEKAEVK